jgi:hypothetical protein
MGQRIVLTYQVPGNVIVDLESGEVIEGILDIYDYGEPVHFEFDNAAWDDPKPTEEQMVAARDIVINTGIDWELG